MDSVEEENNEHNTEKLTDQLPPQGSPGTEEIYDESPVLPRVGDLYQVEIPPLATEVEHRQLKLSQVDEEGFPGFDYPVGIGLAIPIMWCYCQSNEAEREEKQYYGSDACPSPLELENHERNSESTTDATSSACKDESANDREDVGEVTKHTRQECAAVRFTPLPGTSASSWSEAEIQSFLLGLYIFGKNLVQVRRFVESMTMGEILSYYYGEFFRSDAYRRWSECRKIRSRRCILGPRIFTGWRQQELLSRLLPSIPQEIHDSLMEAVKVFNEGRTAFEEFIFALKSTVSMQVLIDAIGIGKGKHDLTGMVLDPARTNLGISMRPEIPVGKACSSLTSRDIIKFLTGDFRLSKARSNDLFWEAVWPRLLARGWHSEQPKDLSTAGSKNPLVFLMPGIKKFSRKKLMKGNHYFDSIADVLNKVASDPRLLELESNGKGNNIVSNENGWADDSNLEQNEPSDHQRQCYLRPRIPNCNSELMKFTVVDTSLVLGEGPFKVRELRTLPVDATYGYQFSTCSGEAVNDSSIEQSESDDNSDDQGESATGKASQSDELDNVVTGSSTIMPVNGHGLSEQLVDVLDTKNCLKDIACHFGRHGKSGQHEYLSPMSKRRRLTTCKHEGAARRNSSFSKGEEVKKEEGGHEIYSCKATEGGRVDGPSTGKMPANYSDKDGSGEKKMNAPIRDPHFVPAPIETKLMKEEFQSGTLIDLNLPHMPPGFEAGDQERPTTETRNVNDGSRIQEKPNEIGSDRHYQTNSRRQSTRSRPPTAKALEALACGFLGTKRKSRDMRVPSSRPPRRARRSVENPVLDPPASCDGVAAGIEDSSAVFVKLEKSNTDQTILSDELHGHSDSQGLFTV